MKQLSKSACVNARAGKVCILSNKHAYFDTRIFYKQALTLSEAGYDVTLIAAHDKDEIVEGVKVIALSRSRRWFQRVLGFDILVLSLALKQKADIYHFHDPGLLPVGIALKLLTNANVIYDIHEDYSSAFRTKSWIPPYLRLIVSKLYFVAERIGLLTLSSMVVAGEDIQSCLPNSSKVTLVRNYPLLDIADSVHRKKKSQDEVPVLIYTGAMGEGRGVEEVIEAVNNMDGKVRLILLGHFSDPEFENEIRKSVGGNIQIVGRVPHEEVFDFMEKSDIGIVCFQPFPNNVAAASRNNKLFEYMSASLPVISSGFPVWKEIVEGNNCGVTIDTISPQEIRSAIEGLVEKPDLLAEMGQNGRDAVLEKYNWQRESEKLLKLYDKLIA